MTQDRFDPGAAMHAAAQQFHGTMPLPLAVARPLLKAVVLPIGLPEQAPTHLARMPDPKPREFFIQGITLAGKTFRPSDWSERLAGALSSFRPKNAQFASRIGAHIAYSPYCVPRVIDGVKCVIVNEALRGLEPMAWDFAMNFARDNELQVVEACLMPDAPPPVA